MDITYVTKKQEELDHRMATIAAGIGKEAIYDGIISPEHYAHSTIKFLWLGREPHSPFGNYDYKRDIQERLAAGKRLVGKRYFDPMRKTLYSAQNGFIDYEKIPNSESSQEVARLMLNVAFLNCSKIPGGAGTNWSRWWKHVEYYKDVVAEQISLANPDVIICAGTRDYLERYGYLQDAIKTPKSYRYYYRKTNTVIFDCYHFSYWSIKSRDYFNDIIDVLRKLSSVSVLES